MLGSSIRHNRGRCRYALANSTIFCCPPERSPAFSGTAVAQDRKLREHVVEPRHQILPRQPYSTAFHVIKRKAQIILYTHERKQARFLRDVADAVVDYAVRRNATDIGAVELDRAGMRAQETANRLHYGGFAGAIEPDQAGDGAGLDVDGDAAKDIDAGNIASAHISHDQKRAHAGASPR